MHIPEYDGLGRVLRSSNPYRTGDSVEWSTTNYDALGRATSVTRPDGAEAKTFYQGSTVSTQDEACRARDLIYDGLGRLKGVREDTRRCAGDPTPLLNYATDYSYDLQDNLIAVSQGNRLRSFLYDTAGRLLSANNPESGTVQYRYDDNGNLKTSTDARSWTTTWDYDALDRPLGKRFPNGSGGESQEYLCYDGKHAVSSGCEGSVGVTGARTGS